MDRENYAPLHAQLHTGMHNWLHKYKYHISSEFQNKFRTSSEKYNINDDEPTLTTNDSKYDVAFERLRIVYSS